MTDKEEVESKVAQITAESKTIEMNDGTELEIIPFENKEFLRLTTGNDRKAKDEVVIDLLTSILQKDDPNVTKEDVEKAPPELTIKVFDAMEQVNGLQDFFSELEEKMQDKQR